MCKVDRGWTCEDGKRKEYLSDHQTGCSLIVQMCFSQSFRFDAKWKHDRHRSFYAAVSFNVSSRLVEGSFESDLRSRDKPVLLKVTAFSHSMQWHHPLISIWILPLWGVQGEVGISLGFCQCFPCSWLHRWLELSLVINAERYELVSKSVLHILCGLVSCRPEGS